jgi:ABC-type branched-subunit amino acid transport system substrate-binding protein
VLVERRTRDAGLPGDDAGGNARLAAGQDERSGRFEQTPPRALFGLAAGQRLAWVNSILASPDSPRVLSVNRTGNYALSQLCGRWDMSSRFSRALLVAVVLVAACGGGSSNSGGTNTASAPGITATQITIGSHQPLTGPAAPGYSEISQASNAYFKWVNDHGGVNGRTINYLYEDDGYNPQNTSTVVHKLVLEDKVFAIFNGLGTPTHLAVVDYLNSQKVPDLFVASGCDCWNNTSKYPDTFGWQPDYIIEGKITGKYVSDKYSGMKVGYLYQDDDFGQGGVQGLDTQISSSNVVDKEKYVPTNTNLGPQIATLQAKGAQVVVLYTIPAFTALTLLTAAALHYSPKWVVSSVGADPTTLAGLVTSFSKGAAGASLLDGIVTSGYLPATTDTSNPWIGLFKQIHDQYISSLPFDGNVEYGMAVGYSFVQLMKKAGRNPSRQDVINALEHGQLDQGPGLVSFQYSSSNHLGYQGVRMAVIQSGAATYTGSVYTATVSGGVTACGSCASKSMPTNGIP